MSTQINNLTAMASLSAGSQVPAYDPANGDTRKFSLTTLMDFLEANMVMGRSKADTQYSAPSATGFSVALNSTDRDVHLILTPVAGYANGTIVLPLNTNCQDKQRVLVNTTQAVTTLAITLNGATSATGAPVTLAANAYFELEYDLATNVWYRIG